MLSRVQHCAKLPPRMTILGLGYRSSFSGTSLPPEWMTWGENVISWEWGWSFHAWLRLQLLASLHLFVMLFQIKFSASNPPRVRCQQRRVEIVMSRDVMVFMVMVVGRRKMSLSGHSPCPDEARCLHTLSPAPAHSETRLSPDTAAGRRSTPLMSLKITSHVAAAAYRLERWYAKSEI